VIDNGVDLSLFVPGRKAASRRRLGFFDQDFVVGYIGGHPLRRGGKEVIDAVARLGAEGNVKGLIVGDSGQADACRQYALSRGVSDSVVVYGQADYGEVPGLMASIDVGLSILKGRERMHSEQKVRQYLATGLCVVGTAGSNDFLRGRDFARIVETDDPEETVDAVASLFAHGHERLADLGGRARGFAESELSFAQRNDRRIELWEEATANSSTVG
jgi:glycosyltransferase involved in cell wall biosynthesis